MFSILAIFSTLGLLRSLLGQSKYGLALANLLTYCCEHIRYNAAA